MIYNCEFPKCNYNTSHRSQIQYHHIVPVELNGSDKDYNRIWLCPTHHTKVFVKESRSGIHSIQGEDSIVIIQWMESTQGRVLEYQDRSGNSFYEWMVDNWLYMEWYTDCIRYIITDWFINTRDILNIELSTIHSSGERTAISLVPF